MGHYRGCWRKEALRKKVWEREEKQRRDVGWEALIGWLSESSRIILVRLK